MTTTSSTTASSGSAILTALGGGSGIDTGSLVTNLVSATYDPKDAALKTKETGIVIQPSAVIEVHSGGGGGYGPPAERSAADHARDLADGFTTGGAK